MPHPYLDLTPDLILDAVESAGVRPDGRLLALNSYENRVYQVGLEDNKPLIAKFYRPKRWTSAQILEEHAFALELATAEIPVVPPLTWEGATLHTHANFQFALFERRGGRAPELDFPEVREIIGRFLGRIHMVGKAKPFDERPTLDIQSFGNLPCNWLISQSFIPADLLPAWNSVADQALDEIAKCYARAGDIKLIRLHGDCHLGNILYTDDGPHFVDFDDCRMGPAIQDLWMLLSGSREEMTIQLRDVMEGYQDFADFDPRELHLIEALRTLRMLHYSYWLASRADDPAFQVAFPWFFGAGAQRYWQNQILALREQVALMQEAPISLRLGH
ncbi:MAG: serine/threonine protein kinase [Rhodocyclaceae bacterium]|nr:serine/threonine protein kinase [Rhodocyclaceae bacterium]